MDDSAAVQAGTQMTVKVTRPGCLRAIPAFAFIDARHRSAPCNGGRKRRALKMPNLSPTCDTGLWRCEVFEGKVSWSTTMSKDHEWYLARYADRQTFSEPLTSYRALDPANDVLWKETYDFVERDWRVYIAGAAEYMYTIKRDIVALSSMNRWLVPKVFTAADDELEKRVDLLRKWANKANDNDVFSIVQGVSRHPPNVRCVLFTSAQKARLEAVCQPRDPYGLRAVTPGPFDPNYPGSERV